MNTPLKKGAANEYIQMGKLSANGNDSAGHRDWASMFPHVIAASAPKREN